MSQTQPQLLTSQLDRGVLVLTITEPHLHSDEMTDALYQELLTASEPLESPKVVLDFGNVKVISAAGLRAMLNFRRHIRQRNGYLLLCSLAAEVADVFFTTRLVSTSSSTLIPFAMAPDAATAVNHLSRNLKS